MKKMPDQSLVEYAKKQLRIGYSPEAIRAALISAGYSPAEISFALRAAGVRRVELSGRKMIFVLFAAFAVFLLFAAGYFLLRPGAKDIAVSLRLDPQQVAPGESLGIAAAFSSEQRREVPVALEFVARDQSRRAVATRTQRIDVGKSAFTTLNLALPQSVVPGDYELRLTARFAGIERVQSAGFVVQKPAPEQNMTVPEAVPGELVPVAPECPAGCDDLNPVTEDFCEEGRCVHRIMQGVCGNGECESGENEINCRPDCGTVADKEAVVQQAVSVVQRDAEKAAMLCSSLILAKDTDPCFAAIAKGGGKSALCANIQGLNARDDCYLDFAFAGDYSVCEQLNNRYYLTSCLSLQNTAIVSEEASQQPAEPEEVP